jgi:altronate hydrolase
MTAPDSVTIRLHAADNVAVTRLDLLPGTAVASEGVTATAAIPQGHKIATRAVPRGEAVRKYDQIIGFASQDIAPGDHVHTHNVEMRDFARDTRMGEAVKATDYVAQAEQASFDGYARANGTVGTRNYIGIISTVNCSATVVRYIADHFRGGALDSFPNVDGVVALRHGTGCGMAGGGEGFRALSRTFGGYARHPNFAGILFVGLGCEVAQVSLMMEREGLEAGPLVRSLVIQETGGTAATVRAGIAHVEEMLGAANAATRSRVPASHLVLGMECGGSDGYSGISANPALGVAADLLVRHGGTAILGETPEIYGAEHLLTRRAVSTEVGERLMGFIRWWEDYTARNGGNMDNNPTPGNKAGGLTTILEKSLGAAAKGGTTNLVGVYAYAERVMAKGCVFMDTPGYDPVSVTGMVAGGANMVCFTTGRGSVFGCKPVPSLKLATNSAMYARMAEDMDVNCGGIVDGDAGVAEVGQEIFDLILETASGRLSRSEALGFGDEEFAPWQIGAVM